MNTNRVRKGFTLIEIVIVLAIAALIMVFVFFAVQGAQRAQRDQSRKDLTNQVSAAAVAYAGNHSGEQPSNAAELSGYITSPKIQGDAVTLKSTNEVEDCAVGSRSNTIWLEEGSGGNMVAVICLETGDVYKGDSTVSASSSASSSAPVPAP